VSLSHFDLWVGSEVGVELSLAEGAGDVEGWEGSVELARPGGAPSRAGFDLIELTRGVRPASRAFRATEKGVHKFTVLLAHPESGAELRGSREFFVTDPTDFPAFSERSRQRAHWKPRPHDPDFITVNIPVDVANRTSARHVHMHAEVHLYDSVGALSSPVAWISGMVTPAPCIYAGQGAVCLSLSLHRGWFARAKLALDDPRGKINLELRHVRLKDPGQEVVVGSLDSPLYLLDAEDAAEWLEEALTDSDFPEEAAEPQKSLLEVQMREGPLAGDWVNGGAWSDISARPGGSEEPDTPQLLLVGGFCSTEAPFPLTDFHRAISATWDSGIAVSNDVFARRILRFSLEKGLDRFAGVGHSQAGNALLHLRTFYWSGMDRVTGGAVMQSTASPYHGASIMNFRQHLPKFIFCDFVQDVTPEGAGAWLRDIPLWPRAFANVYFTTSNPKIIHIITSCNPASEFIMDGTCNDGVVECDRTLLDGANSTAGPVIGGTDGNHGCHLGYPYFTEYANSHDSQNNRRMNDWAAREPLKLR